MSDRPPLLQLASTPGHAGLLSGPGGFPHERADAARNREALLIAAQELVARCGVAAVTMDAVAARAGVGKGTVFRRFESRQGLMGALLDFSEREWQAAVLGGPPPLGPGAPPYDRLVAYGRSRLETTLTSSALIHAAGAAGNRPSAAYSFDALHVRMLLAQLGVTGDLPILTTAILAPLEAPILEQQVAVEGFPVLRIHEGWVDLVDRVIHRPSG
ncbi:MAG: helix-turn-helix domain-containing protein [Lapillicoccus sp.]